MANGVYYIFELEERGDTESQTIFFCFALVAY